MGPGACRAAAGLRRRGPVGGGSTARAGAPLQAPRLWKRAAPRVTGGFQGGGGGPRAQHSRAPPPPSQRSPGPSSPHRHMPAALPCPAAARAGCRRECGGARCSRPSRALPAARPAPPAIPRGRAAPRRHPRASALGGAMLSALLSPEEQWALALTTFAGLSTTLGAAFAVRGAAGAPQLPRQRGAAAAAAAAHHTLAPPSLRAAPHAARRLARRMPLQRSAQGQQLPPCFPAPCCTRQHRPAAAAATTHAPGGTHHPPLALPCAPPPRPRRWCASPMTRCWRCCWATPSA